MIDGKTPKVLGLKDIISKYIDYQREVIIRRTKFMMLSSFFIFLSYILVKSKPKHILCRIICRSR